MSTKRMLVVDDGVVTLPPADTVLIDNPINPDAVRVMKDSTPARICYGRAGARARTVTLLRFLADHAMAMDTVFSDVSEDFLKKMDLMTVQTKCRDKQEFLKRQDLGRKLSDAAKKKILENCDKNKQVQILVVDGLSSNAIEANIPDLLPALMQGLKVEGITYGKPFFIKYGRVWAQDEVAQLVNCDLVISLIGERPGLVTSESLSAYMVYRPDEKTVEADRSVVSNIHRKGIPPAEAGAHLASLLKRMLELKATGVKFQKQINANQE